MAELEIDIVEASPFWAGMDDGLTRALRAAAEAEGVGEGAVALFLADDVAVAALNKQFRAKDGPTNVLSFPPAPGGEEGFLGDIALAAETIAREAENQAKRIEDHAAHLVVHGFLHLLSYDHDSDAEAAEMEARETAILASLGIADPYRERGV